MSELIRHDSVEQGSEDWHDLRRHHFPASMAPWVTGNSRYADAYDALAYFKGEAKEPNQFVARMWEYGRRLEPKARDALSLEIMESGGPAVGTREEYLASLDFLSVDDKTIVEVKCPYHREQSKTWKLALEGKVDPGYADQLEQQYRVFLPEKVFLFVFLDPVNYRLVEYTPDEKRWKNIQEEWEFFADCLSSGAPPERALQDSGSIELASTYVTLMQRVDELTKNAEEIKKQLIKNAAGRNVKVGNVLAVTHHNRLGNVDYAEILKAYNITVDLDQYRAEPTSYSKVRVIKEEQSKETQTESKAPKKPRARKGG